MESNGYIRKLTEFEKLDQRFSSGNMTEVLKYIDSLKFPVDITTTDNGYIVPPRDVDKMELYQNSDIFADYGNGRVSKGLRGLELLSKLCKGVSSENLFLFNNIIYYSNPTKVKSATSQELTNIVINNLGLTNILQNVNSELQDVIEFKNLCLKIGIEVKFGIFRSENYKTNILRICKKLAIAAARGRNV